MFWRAPGWGLCAGAVALVVASACLLGCGEAATPPRAGVALKNGGELATWSPDGRFIAAPDSGAIDLLDADGSLVRRIVVPGVSHSIWPCRCRLGWSEDGKRILFITRRGPGGSPATVGSVGRDGAGLRQVPLGVPAGDATWSPHGRTLVFVANSGAYEFNTPHRGPRPDLWRLDAPGAKPHPILRLPGTEMRPAFSPDGTEVSFLRSFQRRRSIWVVGADGSNPHAVGKRASLAFAAWAPDSRRLAVLTIPTYPGPARLAITPAAGGKPTSVLRMPRGVSALAWSPNGRWIAYGEGDAIWHVHPDGSGRRQIGEVPESTVRRILFSPDGTHLAYTAYENDYESD